MEAWSLPCLRRVSLMITRQGRAGSGLLSPWAGVVRVTGEVGALDQGGDATVDEDGRPGPVGGEPGQGVGGALAGADAGRRRIGEGADELVVGLAVQR